MTKFWNFLKFPQKTGDHNQDLCNNNLYYLRFLSIFRAMLFMIPVWVTMELKYITFSQIAIIEIVIVASAFLLELPTGALADLMGRRKTVTISFFTSVIGFIIFAFANSFLWFFVAAMTFGLADALLSGALEALVFDSLKQGRRENEFSEINNQNQLIFSYSIVIAMMVGGFLFEMNYHLPVLFTALAFFVAGLFSTKFMEPDIDSEIFNFNNYLKQTKMGFKELFKTKQARDMSLFYVLIGTLTWPIIITLKNFALVDLGVNERNIGLILGILEAGSIQLLHFLIKRKAFEKTDLAFLLPSILLAIFFPLSYFYNVPMMTVIIFVSLFVSSMRWNILGNLSHKCYSSKNRATAISSLSMVISFGYIIILGSFSIIDRYLPNAIMLTFTALGVASIFFLFPIAIKLKNKYHNRELETYD